MDDATRKRGYLGTALALSPMAVIKGGVDIPEGMVDKAVEHSIAEKAKPTLKGLVSKDAIRRGLVRGGFHVPFAAATAPIFFSGMKDLKEGQRTGDKKQVRRGYAKVLGSGGILGAGKATAEGAFETAKGTGRFASIAGKGITRAGTNMAFSLPMIMGIAKGEKEREKGKGGMGKYLYPAVGGATSGALKGGIEGAGQNQRLIRAAMKEGKGATLTALRKHVLAPAGGRAAATAIGGLALGELVHRFSKRIEGHEKKSSFQKSAANPEDHHRAGPPALAAKMVPTKKEEPQAQAAPPSPQGPTIPGMKPGFSLFPHQKRAIEKLFSNSDQEGRRGLVVAHGVGSGKTKMSIAAAHALKAVGYSKGSTLVVTPTGLRKNYADAVKEVSDSSVETIGAKGEQGSTYITQAKPGKDFYVIGYELFRTHPEIAAQVGADTIIADEYHKVRNPAGSTYEAFMKVRPTVKNFIGMTGSIANNDPADVAPLVSVASGNRFLSQQQFKRQFERRVARETGFFGGSKYVVGMKNIPQLQQQVAPYIDYISSEAAAGSKMPKKDVEVVEVPMSEEQEEYYKFSLNKLNPITSWKIRNNIGVSDSEMGTVFQQLMHARQVSNSLHTIDPKITTTDAALRTPKVRKLLDDTVTHLKNTPDGQVVIYSNLIHGGVDVATAGLRARGIPFGIFVGKGKEVEGIKSSDKARNQAVQDYKDGKIKAIVISGAGAEGLDLKNTTMVQMMDGHFNPERILQAEARGRRLGGLAHRPQEKRVVKVKRYQSTIERDVWDKIFGKRETSVDQWVYNTAGRKASLNRQLLGALESAQARAPKVTPLEKHLEQVKPFTPTSLEAPAPKVQTLPAVAAKTTFKAPPGVELPKDFKAKYDRRYRTASGEVVYRYKRQPGA